jgi:hypothetical protein
MRVYFRGQFLKILVRQKLHKFALVGEKRSTAGDGRLEHDFYHYEIGFRPHQKYKSNHSKGA